MFDDSDDDDALLPSVGSFENMFANFQRQAKQEPTTKPQDRTPSSSTSKSGSKKGAGHGSRKNSKSSSDKTQNEKASTTCEERGKGCDPKRNIISKDTEDLLAALDNLKKPGVAAASSITAAKRTKEKQDVSKKARKKKGSKDIEEITISSSSEDLGLGEDTEDITYDFDSSQNDNEIEDVRPAVEYSTIRIRWKADQWLRFDPPHGTKMSKIRMDIAEKLNLRADNLVILDEKDSVEISDNMVVENIPFGAALEVFERVNNTASKDTKKLDPNCVQLKVQGSGGYRERIMVVIQRTTHIKQLMDDFIERFGYHGKKFKLVFDGDVTDLDETPESLDLDGGEMFDIVEVS